MEFKKALGLRDATMLVAGSMIGSGIFIVTTLMARDVGSAWWVVILWLVTGFITLAGALSYGELAGMMPKAGGQFVYIHRAFGNLTSFLYGWSVFTVIQTGVIAAVAVAFANYTSVFFPELGTKLIEIKSFSITGAQVLAVGMIVLLTWINSRGVENGKIIQLLFTSSKLIALAFLILAGIIIGLKTGYLSANFSNGLNATRIFKNEDGIWQTETLTGLALVGILSSTIIYSLFSSDAWNNVTYIAGEIRDPEKNIPRSLMLGTIIVTVLYLLANLAYLCILPLHGSPDATTVEGAGIQFAANDRVGSAAAYMIFGDVAEYMMAALIMISTFGCNNGLIMAGSRLYYSMANHNLFLKGAGKINNARVPGNALWMQCIWAGALCLTGAYSSLVAFCTFASLVFYIVCILALFKLRKTEPETPRPYKAFGYPVIPALYILLTTGICTSLIIYDFTNTGYSLLCILTGFPVYFLFFRNAKARDEKTN